MELSNINAKDANIITDLLKTWVSDACCREVRESNPPGCPWQSLAFAFQESSRQKRRNHEASCSSGTRDHTKDIHLITEKQIRERLIHIYRAQTPEIIYSIVEAKLADPLSLFSLAKYKSVSSAMKNWEWYLYCLTFDPNDFVQNNAWGRTPQKDMQAVRIPMDFVDLQLISTAYNAQITVSMIDRPSMRFVPLGTDPRHVASFQHALHLLVHQGHWASLVWPRPMEAELCPLLGSIVELTNEASKLPKGLESFRGKVACVVDFNQTEESYVVTFGRQTISVDRAAVRRILAPNPCFKGLTLTPAEEGRMLRRKQYDHSSGPGPGCAPSFKGIPDGSFEFQLLFELVKFHALSYLHLLKDDLTGEGIEHWQNRHSNSTLLSNIFAAPLIELIPIPDVIEQRPLAVMPEQQPVFRKLFQKDDQPDTIDRNDRHCNNKDTWNRPTVLYPTDAKPSVAAPLVSASVKETYLGPSVEDLLARHLKEPVILPTKHCEGVLKEANLYRYPSADLGNLSEASSGPHSGSPQPQPEPEPQEQVIDGLSSLEVVLQHFTRFLYTRCSQKLDVIMSGSHWTVQEGEELRIRAIDGDLKVNSKVSLYAARVKDLKIGATPEETWLSSDQVCFFLARHSFSPDPAQPKPERFLPFQKGETLLIERRLDGKGLGWAVASKAADRSLRGLVPASYLEPELCLSRPLKKPREQQ